MLVCRRAVITLCSIGVHRNGRADDTFVMIPRCISPTYHPLFSLSPWKRSFSVTYDTFPMYCHFYILPTHSASRPLHVSLPHPDSSFVTRLYISGKTRIGFKSSKLYSVSPVLVTCADPHAHASSGRQIGLFSPIIP